MKAIFLTNGLLLKGFTRALVSIGFILTLSLPAMAQSGLRCPGEAATYGNLDVESFISVTNATSKPLRVHLASGGQREFGSELAPGASDYGKGATTLPVVITDENDNCLFVIVNEHISSSLEFVVREGKDIAPDTTRNLSFLYGIEVQFNDPTPATNATNPNCNSELGLQTKTQSFPEGTSVQVIVKNNSQETINWQSIDTTQGRYAARSINAGETSYGGTSGLARIYTDMQGDCLLALGFGQPETYLAQNTQVAKSITPSPYGFWDTKIDTFEYILELKNDGTGSYAGVNNDEFGEFHNLVFDGQVLMGNWVTFEGDALDANAAGTCGTNRFMGSNTWGSVAFAFDSNFSTYSSAWDLCNSGEATFRGNATRINR